MSSEATVILIVVVIAVIALLAAIALRAQRQRLQRRFGAEYDRVAAEQNSKLRADAELTQRERRVRKLDIRPLSERARQRYNADWTAIQERFVDSPQSAVADAYALVTHVMKERGYPVEDDEEAMSDLSVDHARTVGHFREAQRITADSSTRDAATEDLRQALIHYRALFSDLLGDEGGRNDGHAEPAFAETSPDGAGANLNGGE